ncbi:MAG TPA: methyltransferase domain-containing protein [Xanthobacteraceae bacterium]|nr:methyltransferase domain-containing protein [Xanthobacteraceae bacterium]
MTAGTHLRAATVRQLHWSLTSLHAGLRAPALAEADRSARERALRTRYPIRYLRYWFARCLLDELHARLGRPLQVLEVGIDRGQMLNFLSGAPQPDGTFQLPPAIERWDGLDVQVDAETLKRYGYSELFEANVEDWPDLGGRRYDAIVLLHILEHLQAPEAVMAYLATLLCDQGAMIGGSPTMPDWLARLHERRLRRQYADRMHDVRLHKHLSVITPARVRRFALANDLDLDLLAGTFVMRASGSPLENSAFWVRSNLLWGALFPSLGGEVYFSLRKP